MSHSGSAGPAGSVVVLLGAGRGGTTLLYKLMALHREVGYLSNYQQAMPGWPVLARANAWLAGRHDLKLRAWFGDDGGAYLGTTSRGLKAVVPAPAEGESVYAACGVPLTTGVELPEPTACRRLGARFEELRRHSRAQVMLTKRTSNNRRIAWLEKAFDAPRYVLLLRDGRAVASSLLKVSWWSDHVLFWTGRSPRQMVQEGSDELGLAAQNWVEAMRQIHQGLSSVDPERVFQLRYEDLVAEPRSTLASLLRFIGVDAQADSAFDTSIDRLGLKPVSVGWGRGWTQAQRDAVTRIQAQELERWGYRP